MHSNRLQPFITQSLRKVPLLGGASLYGPSYFICRMKFEAKIVLSLTWFKEASAVTHSLLALLNWSDRQGNPPLQFTPPII